MEGSSNHDQTDQIARLDLKTHTPPETRHVSDEQLHNWVEAGRTENSVAVYGTSASYLKRTLDTGILLPQVDTGEKYMYYFSQFYAKIRDSHPELAADIRSAMTGEPTTNALIEIDMEDKLSIEEAVNLSKKYAQINSIAHTFSEKAGFDCPNYLYSSDLVDESIMGFANLLVPDEFLAEEKRVKGTPLFFAFSEAERIGYDRDFQSFSDKVIADYESSGQLDHFKNALRESIQRRGVLIYYSDKIFNDSTSIAEFEQEVATQVTEPFSTDVIEGIEFLSDNDREDVLRK